MSRLVCQVKRLGLVPYQAAWEMQNRFAGEIARAERPPTLLLLEHPHTFTFGRRGRSENLLWETAELDKHQVEVHWVDRGGDVTYHGPGQLVGYPLLPLDTRGLYQNNRIPQADYVGYLRRLERTLIASLHKLGIKATCQEGLTGVWVESPLGSGKFAKIAAIGVKVDAQGVTRHGFALNLNPDMSYWQGIIACGLHNQPVTSLAEIFNPSPNMDQVIRWVIWAFGKEFQYDMIEMDSLTNH